MEDEVLQVVLFEAGKTAHRPLGLEAAADANGLQVVTVHHIHH